MVEVNKEELAVIRELEKITGREIPQIEGRKFNFYSGYQTDKEGQIVRLYLAFYGLELIDMQILGQLRSLTELCLSYNHRLGTLEGIRQLKNLTKLDLSNNQLTYVSEGICELKNLTKLDLSNNQLTNVPEGICELKKLTKLALSDNQLISVPEGICELKNLTVFDLYKNQLIRIPEGIRELKKLTKLNFGGNQLTSIPERINELKNLMEIDLSNNQLTSMPEGISQLKNLTKLDLSSNQLTNVPEGICELKNLTKLALSNNQLINIPEGIKELKKLTNLNFSGNQLTSVPAWIRELKTLRELALSDNQLISVPEGICELKNLTVFDLYKNQLIRIPEGIRKLKKLTNLNFGGNQLTSVPEWIRELKNLMELDLSDNQLTRVPEGIRELKNLTKLNIRCNPINDLPDFIFELGLEVVYRRLAEKGLLLGDTLLEVPPLDVVRQGNKAIRNYLRQLREAGKDKLYEAKLLIVGEPEAGKTSLAKKILDPSYELQAEEGTTRGIDIRRWDFPMRNGRSFRVNMWDFGGQQIYYSTHQFFLTHRSLYALVIDIRKEDFFLDYWFNTIQLLGQGSPVLLIKNEKQNRKRSVDEEKYKKSFPNFKEALSMNLADNRGLEQITTTLKNYITKLPHVGTPLPATWIKVREALEQDKRNYISLGEYLGLCDKYGFKRDEDKLQLSDHLHVLGVILHFQKDDLLKHIIILKPEWGTKAVYKLLDDDRVIRKHGRFKESDLTAIWHEVQYEGMHRELLRLMINFRLCYQIPDSNEFIVPQLLSDSAGDYHWGQTDNLHLQYRYEFMPRGILTRLIVAMNAHIARQGEDEMVWKEGVMFEKEGARAEVIENLPHRVITIRVAGIDKKGLLYIVCHELEKIHGEFHGLKVQKLIPCNCYSCRKILEPEFYPFEILLRYLSDGEQTIQCRKSYKQVNVLGIIDNSINLQQIVRSANTEFAEETCSEPVLLDILRRTGGLNLNFNPTLYAPVAISPKIDTNVKVDICVDIQMKLPEIQHEFEELKDWMSEVLPEKKGKLEQIQNDLDSITPTSSEGEKNRVLNKAVRILKDFGDEKSELGKTLKGISKGIEYTKKGAKLYNKIAPFIGLPPIPLN